MDYTNAPIDDVIKRINELLGGYEGEAQIGRASCRERVSVPV